MDTYITDCGYPSETSNPVKCTTCTVCCNSDDLCYDQHGFSTKPIHIEIGLTLSIFGTMIVIYLLKDKIVQNKYLVRVFENKVAFWRASELIGEKSVYHFFLTPNWKGWLIALACAVVQLAMLWVFVSAADVSNKENDIEYTVTCAKNSLECEDIDSRSSFGYSIFGLLLTAWLLRDIVGSFKLFLLSLWEKKIDFLFASCIIMIVTLFSALTSIYYNLAIGTKDTDIITNAAILLFVNEIDERLYQLAEACNIKWVLEVNESLQRNSYFNKRELLIYRALHKVRKRLRRLFSIEKEQELANNDDQAQVQGALGVEKEASLDVTNK